jgi:hypothetical protein
VTVVGLDGTSLASAADRLTFCPPPGLPKAGVEPARWFEALVPFTILAGLAAMLALAWIALPRGSTDGRRTL